MCKVREEPAPCLITAQGATGCDGVWQCVAGRARTKCSLREAQCIELSKDLKSCQRSRHIERRHLKLRELVAAGHT